MASDAEDEPLMVTMDPDAPPDQFTVTPCARLTDVVDEALVHVNAGGIATLVLNEPTSLPPGPVKVKLPPVDGMYPEGAVPLDGA